MRRKVPLPLISPRWRLLRWTATPTLVALAVISCRDVELPPTAPMAAAPAARLAVLDPHSGDWNRFDADVDVIVESGGSPLLSARKSSRGLTYHLTRRRDASGQWVSDLGFEELIARTSSGLARGGAPYPKRIIATSAGEAGTMVDASGRPISVRAPSMTEASINPPSRVARGPRAARPMPTLRPGQAGITDTSRAWAQIFFPTRAGADAMIGDADAVESLTGDRGRHRSQRGAFTAEITLNRATGALEEARIIENGSVRSVTSSRYEPDQNGVLTLRTERKLLYARGRNEPDVITITYRNIRLSKEP
jgi:hypothetical protein